MSSYVPANPRPLLPATYNNLFYPPALGTYRYFEHAAECPYAGNGLIVKAAWAADAAMLCYANSAGTMMSTAEFTGCFPVGQLHLIAEIGQGPDWNVSGTQAFLAEGNGFAILAFRGTEVRDPQDVADDADLAWAVEPPGQGVDLNMLHPHVHAGFQRALDRVWGYVQKLLSNYRTAHPNSEICITGHSLGGALALLTYSRWADQNTSAYTFGCPRVGNTAFAGVVQNHGLGHFRFVTRNDIVTHVPPQTLIPELSYCHSPENCYQLDADHSLHPRPTANITLDLTQSLLDALPIWGEFKKDPIAFAQNPGALPAPPAVLDHSPAQYCMQLWDCAITPTP